MMAFNKSALVKMVSPIETPDGSYDLSYRVSIRSGATGAMMVETVSHFLHAAGMLAAGELNCQDEAFNERSELELSSHGGNRIVIFGDIKVFTASGFKLLPVNVFCETTSAQEYIDFAWMVMDGIGQVMQLPNVIKFVGNGSHPKPKSELDNHFGERKETAQPPQDGSTTPPATPGQPVLIDYDYKLNEQYEKEFVGRLVEVKVEKIARMIKAKKDGTGSYEMIFVFQKAHYESPIFNLNMFPMKPGDTFGSGKELDRIMPGVFAKAGDSIEGEFGLIYKISKSKDGRVFWNLKDVKIYQSHTPQLEEAIPSADDIPF